MKKILIIALLIFTGIVQSRTVCASDYTSYQDFEFENYWGRLLDQYTKEQMKDYYTRIEKKKFWGWKVYTVTKNEKVYFTKETLFKIFNEGETPITDTFTVKIEESVKKQYNVKGSLKLISSGDAFGVKLGFEEKLDYSITATTASQREEEFTIKINVDPGTKLIVEICGEGKVSNGIAKKYRFWRNVKKGGWEVFIVTTEYYSISKEYIDGEPMTDDSGYSVEEVNEN